MSYYSDIDEELLSLSFDDDTTRNCKDKIDDLLNRLNLESLILKEEDSLQTVSLQKGHNAFISLKKLESTEFFGLYSSDYPFVLLDIEIIDYGNQFYCLTPIVSEYIKDIKRLRILSLYPVYLAVDKHRLVELDDYNKYFDVLGSVQELFEYMDELEEDDFGNNLNQYKDCYVGSPSDLSQLECESSKRIEKKYEEIASIFSLPIPYSLYGFFEGLAQMKKMSEKIQEEPLYALLYEKDAKDATPGNNEEVFMQQFISLVHEGVIKQPYTFFSENQQHIFDGEFYHIIIQELLKNFNLKEYVDKFCCMQESKMSVYTMLYEIMSSQAEHFLNKKLSALDKETFERILKYNIHSLRAGVSSKLLKNSHFEEDGVIKYQYSEKRERKYQLISCQHSIFSEEQAHCLSDRKTLEKIQKKPTLDEVYRIITLQE